VPAPDLDRVAIEVTECLPKAANDDGDRHASSPRGTVARGGDKSLALTPLVIPSTLHGARTFSKRRCHWYRAVSATMAALILGADLAMERFVERFNN
jgi:hypothetical protein